jgi:glycosyltransferase involved in cell wall biosynthesis
MRTANRVTIIQRVLPHYRVPFFLKLREELASSGIELVLIYGQENAGTVPKSVAFSAPWVRRVQNVYFSILGLELVWQRGAISSASSALVIVEQSNRLVVNLVLIALRPLVNFKLAFWGHGKNFQSTSARWSEYLKKVLITRVDWWFAYTTSTAELVAEAGFSPSRITNVQNAIDTSAMDAHLRECDPGDIAVLRSNLNLIPGYVGLFCGGMYDHKQLPFLIEACLAIKKKVPEFSMLFVGDGPDETVVKNEAQKHGWIHYVGPKFGAELAPFYRVSNVFLLPGALGLSVIDSFVSGIPIFTTASAKHGPERDFLQSGKNGVVTTDSVEEYAGAVAEYFYDSALQAELKRGLDSSKENHSLDVMVSRFASGVRDALN